MELTAGFQACTAHQHIQHILTDRKDQQEGHPPGCFSFHTDGPEMTGQIFCHTSHILDTSLDNKCGPCMICRCCNRCAPAQKE